MWLPKIYISLEKETEVDNGLDLDEIDDDKGENSNGKFQLIIRPHQ